MVVSIPDNSGFNALATRASGILRPVFRPQILQRELTGDRQIDRQEVVARHGGDAGIFHLGKARGIDDIERQALIRSRGVAVGERHQQPADQILIQRTGERLLSALEQFEQPVQFGQRLARPPGAVDDRSTRRWRQIF